MTDIRLGQSISASFVSSNTQSIDLPNEYNLPGLDSFRQLKITVQRPAGTTNDTTIELIDLATGDVLAQSIQTGAGTLSLLATTFPGINYKVRVAAPSLGDYQLALTDGGKATSIVSPQVANVIDNSTSSLVGTIGQSGTYFSLASGGNLKLTDIAYAPNGQFYGIGAAATSAATDLLYRIDPSLDRSGQVQLVGEIRDAQGISLSSSIQALEFTSDNKLYGLGYAAEGAKLYQIDVNTNVATTVATLPQAFLIGGDLSYDAAGQRFLATSLDATNTSSDALWQIPFANPAGATKIGMTGFTDVYGLVVENGQLYGYTANIKPDGTGATRIKLDLTSGKGTFDRAITGTQTFGIGGAATIPGAGNDGLVLNVVSLNPTPTNAIGSKSQGLAQSNTIDLSDYAGTTLTADITTKSDAAYTNNIGFYIVEDSIGTIKLADGSTLKPNDANYAVEAIKNALTNSLQAAQIDTKVGQNITGGLIYAPVVVAQGSLTDFLNKNPTNGGDISAIHAYFNYVGANSDGVDHFKFLGNNTFGVEDMYGGGDRDFNDLVVNMSVRAA